VIAIVGGLSVLSGALTMAGLVSIFIILLNCTFWFYEYQSEPGRVELKKLRFNASVLDARLKSERDRLGAVHLRKKALASQQLDEERRLTIEENSLKDSEKKEIARVGGMLQAELSTLNARRMELHRQRADKLKIVDDGVGRPLSKLRLEIAAIDNQAANELAFELKKLQDQYVTDYLNQFTVINAAISGIGPGFKLRLMRSGIHTAADVDNRIRRIPGIGPSRQASLESWRDQLKQDGLQKMPKALPADQLGRIHSRYSTLRGDLEMKRGMADSQYNNEAGRVKAPYENLFASLDVEQGKLLDTAKTRTENIQASFNQRCRTLQEKHAILQAELKRNICEIDRTNSDIQMSVFQLHWQKEKLMREIGRFDTLTFLRYAMRLIKN
jgi:hypothetical protein